MNGVFFRDAEDRPGRVTEDLVVDYHGEWNEAVEACVRRIEAEHGSGAGEAFDADVSDELLIELPEEAPIVEIERVGWRDLE